MITGHVLIRDNFSLIVKRAMAHKRCEKCGARLSQTTDFSLCANVKRKEV
jgi:hypothetical protein